MNLGGFKVFAAAVFVALSLVVAGCGSDSDNSAAVNPAASGASGATGASDSTSSKKSEKKSSKKKSSDSSGDTSSSKSGGSDSSSSAGSQSGDSSAIPNKAGTISASDKKAVRSAFNRLIAALDSKDVDYICGSAYSDAYIEMLKKQGGCVKVTDQGLSNITGYSAKVRAISMVDNTTAAVSAELKPGAGKPNNGTIYFAKQDGSWKRVTWEPKGTTVSGG